MVIQDLEKYRVVSFDLDGTITESRQPIEKNIVDLLNTLSKRVLVVIISGSSFENLLTQLELFLNSQEKELFKKTLLMPTNGSQTYSYDEQTNTWVLSESVEMSKTTKEKVCEVLEKMITLDSFDIPKLTNDTHIQDRKTQISFSGLGFEAPLSEKLTWDPNQKKRTKIVEFIKPLLPEADIFIAGTTTIDILPKGMTKGVMLKKMLENKDYKKEELLFIGDAIYENGNDYEVAREGFDYIKTSGPKETAEIIWKLIT